MNVGSGRTIVVTGATGRQGRAVAHALLQNDWHVRALTRNPSSGKAQMLSNWGAEVLQADMNDPMSLLPAFHGAYGVFSVQNPMISGIAAEITQGKNVADAAKQANIQHLVYASAGIGSPTGVPSWDSKLQVEAHIKALNLPVTVVRPMAFMELLVDKGYYPQVSTWHLMPKLMGERRPIVLISTHDVGLVVAKAFVGPTEFIGKSINLASDVKSIEECRVIYRRVTGKQPPRFPMPVWMFKRFVGEDLLTMWDWLKTGMVDLDTTSTRAILPDAMSTEQWLQKWKNMELPTM